MANKRIMKEFAGISADPPPGCDIKLAQEGDLHLWDVYMDGPADSPYKSGKFHIQVTIPKEYPFKPPTLSFRTKIYHPNVSNDERGAMCLGMLKAEEWKPPNKISDVLRLVATVLAAPQPDDAVEASIAELFKNQPAEFDRVARDWTTKFAR